MKCGVPGCHREADKIRSWNEDGDIIQKQMCMVCRNAFDIGLRTTANEVVDSEFSSDLGGSE